MFILEYPGRAPLMVAVGIGVDKAYGDGRYALLAKPSGGLPTLHLIERTDYLPSGVYPFRHFLDVCEGYQPGWLDPHVDGSPFAGHGLPRQLENMAKAFGNQESDTRKFMLQQGIHRYRSAMDYMIDLCRVAAGASQQVIHRIAKTDIGILRRRGDLQHDNAAVIPDGLDVGKGPTRIDSDAKAHGCVPDRYVRWRRSPDYRMKSAPGCARGWLCR